MRRGETHFRAHGSRGFSLLEVMIAVMILGIGLIMVASVFPVGAAWTRQSSEETLATNLAWNAVSIIRTKYVAAIQSPNTGFNYNSTPPTPYDVNDAYYKNGIWCYNGAAASTVVAAGQYRRVFTLPLFGTVIPVQERTYGFGMSAAYPVSSTAKCQDAQYSWTALMKVPDDNSANVTLYILVFHRGSRDQVFTLAGMASPPLPAGVSATDLIDCRDETSANTKYERVGQTAGGNLFTPSVCRGIYQPGTFSGNAISGAWPPMGVQGIWEASGAVFRQQIASNFTSAQGSTTFSTNDGNNNKYVITAVPPDGSSGNPLIFIYQTQISF